MDCVRLKERVLDAKDGSVLTRDSERPENIVCSETSGVLKKLDKSAIEVGILFSC